MTGWPDKTIEPAHGALFGCAMGRTAVRFSGAAVTAANGDRLTFAQPHDLSVQQAVASAEEIRFVTAILSSTEVQVNARFSGNLGAGTRLEPTITYRLGPMPSSATIYDHWDPANSVQRLLAGAIVDEFRIHVNGDFHEFEFAGPAADLVDSASFVSGQAGMSEFPAEPAIAAFDYAIVPGHLGQAWIGATAERLYTVTEAEVVLRNNVELRANEFGRQTPAWFGAGVRNVAVGFSLYERDDEATRSLYQAARQRSPISVMFQLGQHAGQLAGIYLKSVIPEVPAFDDSDTRLQWQFQTSRAEGIDDDELVIAFA
ncbi:MAG TPA: hypothetical protein VFL57_02645 [Bryobacteraceae bacterium]|nr:hypothetical protein [Bryobacteraceae bacterium]